MKDYKRILVTAALPYANGPLHIGHLAGCYIPADIYVRYQRAQKRDIKFVGGSDEHGVPITIRAMKEGVSPQAVVDKYHEIIRHSLETMDISFDIYSRTSNAIHHQTAQDFFKNYMTMVCLKKKKRNNTMMRRQRPSLPIDTSLEHAPFVEMKTHMATNAKDADRV